MGKSRIANLAVSVVLLLSVIAAVLFVSAPAALVDAWSSIATSSILIIMLCLTVGMLLSALRLKFITADLGYSLSMRDATMTLSVGQLAGNLFFQSAGQLIGRGAVLARRGIGPSASVMISGYERILALCISVTLAAGGAFYLFGRLSFNLQAGGLTLMKLLLGLAAAIAAGAALAWGPHAARVLRQLTPALTLRLLRGAALSLAIQLTTLAAYIVAGRALAPHIDFVALAAASCVIMFAASLPISLGGWGMREMSAIMALQMVGLSSAAALLVGLLIGGLSIAVVGVTAACLIVGGHRSQSQRAAASAAAVPDYTAMLDWLIPAAAATAVFFQIYIPTGRGALNVNLADPVVLVGAALFGLRQIGLGWPQWRLPQLNFYIVAASAVIGFSFLHGLAVFGWTEWAFTNRLVGWGILLCYGVTGALIARRASDEGLELLLLVFVATGAAIAGLELCIVALIRIGLTPLIALVDYRITGFSQNPNAFSFVLLMTLAAALTLQGRLRWRIAIMAIVVTGLCYAGSRAGILAAPVVIALALVSGVKIRPILAALASSAAILLALAVLPYVPFGSGAGGPSAMAQWALQSAIDNQQHIETVLQGLAMFLAHPLFGAGLGAYMAEQLASTGVPLVIHSTPVWLLAETGLAGFAVFAFAGWRIFSTGFSRRSEPAGLLVVLTLTGFAVMTQAHDLLYQRALWLLLGAALAIGAEAAKPATKPLTV